MKTGSYKSAIKVHVLAQADCPRCERVCLQTRPNCEACGMWLPWGDEWVTAEANRRDREFKQQWGAARADANAHAPTKSLALQDLRRFILPVAVSCSFVFGAVASSLLSGQTRNEPTVRELQQTNALRRVASDREPTGLCRDGSETFAQSSRGACSGHGGVSQFYK